MLDTKARKYIQPAFEKTADVLLKYKLSANNVTIIAFVIGLISATTYYFNMVTLAVILLWLSGFLDAVDGTMARKTKPTGFGTILDIVFDRIVEIGIIVAIGLKYPEVSILLILLQGAIITSMTVFLTVGAVAEKYSEKSFYYQPGLAERTEGFIFFTLMMIFRSALAPITIIYTLVIFYTALQRMNEARKIMK